MKICVCGNFAKRGSIPNEGQSIKTKCLFDALVNQYGSESVLAINTYGGKKNIIKVLYKIYKALATSENLVVLPAQSALKLTPCINVINCIYKRSIHYIVIGGWLDEYVAKHKIIGRALKKYSGIYVETHTMKTQLEKRGYRNIIYMPNMREIHTIDQTNTVGIDKKPLRLCTFSRVMREKGIADAVDIVKKINDSNNQKVYTLDIYGPVEKGEEEWFRQLSSTFSDAITYKGIIEYNRTVEVLHDYFALLFPTHFYTEGIPGTIIDAFESGLPVIYSRWEHAEDVLDSRTGIGYEFANTEDLEEVLVEIMNNPVIIMKLRQNCLNEAEKYDIKKSINILTDRFM